MVQFYKEGSRNLIPIIAKIVPQNIIGIKGIFFFFISIFGERIFIIRKATIPNNDASNADKINPGNPEINPQNIL